MIEKLLLYVTLYFDKLKLRKYKRKSKPYEKNGIIDNWYNTNAIPELEKEISIIEGTLKG